MAENKQPPHDSERRVLEMALEFYVRLGLGQFSQIAQRLDLLCGKRLSAETLRKVRRAMDRLEGLVWDGKPWMLRDEDTSIYTLTGSLVDARMTGDDKFVEWAERRVNEKIKAGETVR